MRRDCIIIERTNRHFLIAARAAAAAVGPQNCALIWLVDGRGQLKGAPELVELIRRVI